MPTGIQTPRPSRTLSIFTLTTMFSNTIHTHLNSRRFATILLYFLHKHFTTHSLMCPSTRVDIPSVFSLLKNLLVPFGFRLWFMYIFIVMVAVYIKKKHMTCLISFRYMGQWLQFRIKAITIVMPLMVLHLQLQVIYYDFVSSYSLYIFDITMSLNRVVISDNFCYCLLNSCFKPVVVLLSIVWKYHLDL